MTGAQPRALPIAAAGAGLAAAFVLLQRPTLAIVLGIAVVLVLLAIRSVVFPVALAGLPNVYIALAGYDPFPHKAVPLGLFAWTALAIAVAVARVERDLPRRVLLASPVLLTIVLLVLIVAHASGSPAASSYLSTKLQFFLATNLVGLLAGILIGRRRQRFALWAVVTLAVSAVSAAVLAHGLASGTATTYADRFTIGSSYDPIAFGRDTGRGLLLAVWLLLATHSARTRTLALAALPALAVAFFASGSRGPVLGLAAGLLVLLPLSLDQPGSRKRVLLVVLGGFVGAFLVSQLVPAGTLDRSFSFVLGAGGTDQSNGRFHLWGLAWNAFREHPLLGIGTGGFAVVDPVQLYPHNILLEVLAEFGVVGGLLFAGFVGGTIAAIWRVYRRGVAEDRAQAAVVAALFAAALGNAMFSGDITANASVWVAAGLAVGLAQRQSVALAAGRRRPWQTARGLPLRTRRGSREGQRPMLATPTSRRPGSPGAILSPTDGAVVSSIVSVKALPATTGWGAAAATLEMAAGAGDEWRRAAVADEEAIDVFAVDADGIRHHVAIARSQRVADRLAAELARDAAQATRFETERSRRKPWHVGPSSFEWDTSALEPGRFRLRLVTVDLTGLRIVSPELTVSVQSASETTTAPARDEPGPLADRDDVAIREGALTEREAELEQREQGLLARVAAITARERELARRAAELALRSEALDEREAAAVELGLRAASEGERREQELARRSEAVAARERELAGQADELALRVAALDERFAARAAEFERSAQGLAEQSEAVAARERELAKQADELARRASALDAIEAVAAEQPARDELAARAEELEQRELGLSARLEAITARERAMARHAGELARRDIALAERETAAAAQAADAEELAARAAELARREHRLKERLEVVTARERAIARQAGALTERERAAASALPAPRPPEPPARVIEPPRAAPPPQSPTPPAPAAQPQLSRLRPRLATVRLWELERLVAEHPDPDSYVREERQALLFHLRDHASADGLIPEQFQPLLDEAFGDLLSR